MIEYGISSDTMHKPYPCDKSIGAHASLRKNNGFVNYNDDSLCSLGII